MKTIPSLSKFLLFVTAAFLSTGLVAQETPPETNAPEKPAAAAAPVVAEQPVSTAASPESTTVAAEVKQPEPAMAADAAATANAPAAAASESSPPAASTIEKLVVYPDSIELNSVRDSQSLVAQLVHANGITRDVSDQIQLQIANPELLKQAGRVLHPGQDGETVVKVELEGFSVEVPVKVTDAQTSPPVSFTNDVMPVFSKAGCNAGSCHGAARGKDGFRLSLYGFDPQGDYHRLTREMLGRRINLAVPDDCLLMSKATGEVPHSGGKLFSPDSQYYQTLLTWLESGAVIDAGPIPSVTGIELYPKSAVLNGPEAVQQLTVRAKYSDGTDRDVTSLAYFSTNNDNAAVVSQEGMVAAKNRGEAFVMARFDTHTVGADFIVLPKDVEFTWQEIPENNYVDILINEKLRKLRIQPSELCTDAEFIRRVSIDICGVVPSAETIHAFLDDPDPDKRAKLVDDLLNRKEFVELWVMKWSELLQVRSTQQVSYKATLLVL